MQLKKALFSLICLNYAIVNADQSSALDLYVEPANLNQYIVSKPYPKVKLSSAFGSLLSESIDTKLLVA